MIKILDISIKYLLFIIYLNKINKILLSPLHDRIKEIEFIVACDVSNFLTGPNGATYVFGEQKGATKEDLNYLENSILHFSKIVSNTLSKNDANKEGAGAAGGRTGSRSRHRCI